MAWRGEQRNSSQQPVAPNCELSCAAAAMPDKRAAAAADAGGDGGRRKRSRWGEAPPAAAAAAAAPQSDAEKLAALQARIHAQMAGLGSAVVPAAKPAPAAPGGGMGVGAIRMDAQGRLVDAMGNVMDESSQRRPQSTLAVNVNAAKAGKKGKKGKWTDDAADAQKEAEEANPYFDPRMAKQDAARPQRFLAFQGMDSKANKNTKRANRLRQHEQAQEYEEELRQQEVDDMAGKASALGTKDAARQLGAVPDVEWWDAPFLLGGALPAATEALQLNEEQITAYVEHPVPVDPPAEPAAPPPMPLFLTKAERKKLRTRRRLEAERDRQEQVRMGLIPAPQNKVKISNFMWSMYSDAVADPTQIEAGVRKQMKERTDAHEARNEERKLTADERKAKNATKMRESPLEVHVAVYKVDDFANPKNRYKVDVNAAQNHLTGCVVLCNHFNLVVAEGGPKALKRYAKLMLRRIDWSLKRVLPEGASEEEREAWVEETPEEQKKREDNKCVLVWQGIMQQPTFQKWQGKEVGSALSARKFLDNLGIAHCWDLAAQMHQASLAGTADLTLGEAVSTADAYVAMM